MKYISCLNKHLSPTKFIFGLWFFAANGHSEPYLENRVSETTLQGEVSTRGTPDKRQTLITGSTDKKSTVLCKGGKKFELTQLAGSVVTAIGQMKTQTKAACFLATSYTINDISPGHPAVVGQLQVLEPGTYAIVESSGKIWKLSKLAPSLKDSVNKRVVTELAQSAGSSHETLWIVIRAFGQPTQ